MPASIPKTTLPEVPTGPGITPAMKRFLTAVRNNVHSLNAGMVPPQQVQNLMASPIAGGNRVAFTRGDADYYVLHWSANSDYSKSQVVDLGVSNTYDDIVGVRGCDAILLDRVEEGRHARFAARWPEELDERGAGSVRRGAGAAPPGDHHHHRPGHRRTDPRALPGRKALRGPMTTPKASPAEMSLTAVGTSDITTQQNLLNQNNSTGAQFEGPVTSSPYYKALVSAGTSATTGAYNNAQAAVRARANAAGYNYTQPVTQGAEAEQGTEEAQSLAQVPTQAAIAAVQPELQQEGINSGEENTFSPNTPLSTSAGLYNQRQQIGASFLNSLIGAGTGAVSKLIPNASFSSNGSYQI